MGTPTEKEIAQYYEEKYLKHHPGLHLAGSEFKASEILQGMKNKKVSSLIDLGCGGGNIGAELQRAIKSDLAVGCDISGAHLQLAKKNRSLFLVKADCQYVPVRNASVDLVLLIDVIEHLRCPRKAIAEARRISKNWIVFRTPIEDCVYHNLMHPKGSWDSQWKEHHGHLSRFGLSYLKNLLQQYRLRIVELHISRTPLEVVRRKIFSRGIIGYILLRLIPFSIYSRVFPVTLLIFTRKCMGRNGKSKDFA